MYSSLRKSLDSYEECCPGAIVPSLTTIVYADASIPENKAESEAEGNARADLLGGWRK